MGRWRLDKLTRSKGVNFSVRTGKDRERVSISLGYCGEAKARDALRMIQQFDDEGRIEDLYQLKAEDPAGCRQLLLHSDASVLRPRERDWSRAPLEDYFHEVYAPWRSIEHPGGWRTDEGRWRFILRKLGGVRLRDIDAHVAADYLDSMVVTRGSRAGQPAAGSTKRLHRNAIKALLKRAFRERHIPHLPDLAIFRIKGSTKRVFDQVDPLNLEELLALMNASEPKYRAMWALAAGQGLRPSELVRVRWEDVIWGEQTLSVRGTKTDASAAVIPLTPVGHDELRTWWIRCGQPTEGIAFPAHADGTPYPNTPSPYKKALAGAAARAGIERKVTPYLLRHSFATIAWSVGIDKGVTRRIGRWTDDTMLDRVYCRPRLGELAERVAAFNLSAL